MRVLQICGRCGRFYGILRVNLDCYHNPHVRFLGHQQCLDNVNLVFEVFVNLTQVFAGDPILPHIVGGSTFGYLGMEQWNFSRVRNCFITCEKTQRTTPSFNFGIRRTM